jgi:hypothetical protein
MSAAIKSPVFPKNKKIGPDSKGLKKRSPLVAGVAKIRTLWKELKFVFENRGDYDGDDCPRVGKSSFQPTGGRVCRLRLFIGGIVELRRFRYGLHQGIFNVIDRILEQFFLDCCRINITLKAFFHSIISFRPKDSKKISIFKGPLCDFLYIYSKLEILHTLFGVFERKKVFLRYKNSVLDLIL